VSDPTVLTRHALNRATLDRQMLLRRSTATVPEVLEHLGGLQAQTPHSWYAGLWTRIEGFAPQDASDLLESRAIVRMALMRSTIHLVTADDCLAFRPLVQVVSERALQSNFGRNLVGLETDALVAAGRAAVDDEPLTFSQLGKRLAERWPDRDPASLAQAIRVAIPLVQVPPRGVWGRSGQARHTSVEAWLGRSVVAEPSIDDLVLRYLRAFGPASVKDVQTWCGLTRLGEVVERLGARLMAFRDDQGRDLFDLPDAPRPDPDTPAPVRFMYDFDNLFLSYDDRSRCSGPTPPAGIYSTNGPLPGGVLVDGVLQAAWTIERQRRQAVLKVQGFVPLPAATRAEIADEGAALLAFAAADADTHDVRFLGPDDPPLHGK
jgi:hypothetical protein